MTRATEHDARMAEVHSEIADEEYGQVSARFLNRGRVVLLIVAALALASLRFL